MHFSLSCDFIIKKKLTVHFIADAYKQFATCTFANHNILSYAIDIFVFLPFFFHSMIFVWKKLQTSCVLICCFKIFFFKYINVWFGVGKYVNANQLRFARLHGMLWNVLWTIIVCVSIFVVRRYVFCRRFVCVSELNKQNDSNERSTCQLHA